ncbi:hypothetical protein FQN49_001696 [Arthroderma sp. PD_2]|nr:hypothetical protein FQN49_001696 [Arthroderma sp. PD_2]
MRCASTKVHSSLIRLLNSLLYPYGSQQTRRFTFFDPNRTSRLLDRRLVGLGRLIEDEYANIRDSYRFDELRIAKRALPAIHYWRGIKDAYSINGVEVITAPVSPSASIEQRAEQLIRGIESRIQGRKVNIIAGLDARYMISKLRPTTFEVGSLTTIATPHQGSAVADYTLEWLGEERLSQAYFILDRLGLENGAFKQLTRKYLTETFNPNVINVDGVKYYSYGAILSPDTWSIFGQSRRILDKEEGPNDGLVSVASSRWGCYKGTLVGVSHLDLINWTNRLKWFAAELTGNKKKFNGVAFYLDIAEKAFSDGTFERQQDGKGVMVTILSDSDESARENSAPSLFSESPRPAKRRRLYNPPVSSNPDIESSQAEGEEEETGEDSVDDDDGIDIGLEGGSEEDSDEESDDGLPPQRAHTYTSKGESTKQPANNVKIYQPKYYTNQEPVFVTQLTQPSSSPSRIRGPRWKKPSPQTFLPKTSKPDPTPSPSTLIPRAEPAEEVDSQQEIEGSDEDIRAAIRESLISLREETSVHEIKTVNRIADNPRPNEDLASSPRQGTNGDLGLTALGLDFDPDDIPDVFDSSPLSSPRQAPKNGPISITPQPAPQASQWRQSSSQQQSFRQTTLFGGIASNQLPSQSASRAWPLATQNEPPTHHKLNPDALNSWTFPMNLGRKRDYQYNISQRGLFHNLLVALPTGLGKTFIAATVMLNWFRWTKDAQIVFVAPTRPLVSQQVDACFNIVGIPRSQTTMLTGNVAPGLRAVEWQTKRVFFMTPQTLINDLKSGIADPKRIVLLVVDEAHRATGAYVYVEVVKFIQRFNTSFRILALTATPGSTVETVQEVIDGLNISRVEIRTEESLDIREYVHAKNVETISLSNSDDMKMCMEQFSKALKPVVEKLRSLNAYWGDDPMSLTPFGLTEARKKWMMSPAGRNSNWGLKGMVNSIFTVLASLAHATELLKYHGIGPFYRNLVSFRDGSADGGQGKGGKYARQILDDGSFKTMMTTLRSKMTDEDFIGHPKLEYLKRVILNHFLDADTNNHGETPSKARVMVFSHFRDSAEEIVRVLKKHAPIVLPHVFVGQASAKGSEGMDQKKQLEVIKQFKDGTYNTIVATSIGEEGLDIGEVDLIICYDSSASPIRMLQRMGRTGRKRTGKVVLLLMEGKEEDKYIRAKDNYEKMQQIIASGSKFTFHEDKSPRIIPRDIQPCVNEKRIEIPIENTQAELPVPTKRGRVPKRPPKKFHMPDGVETGFTNALSMTGASKKRQKPKEVPKYREPSPELAELPPLREVTLTPSQTLELRRNFQTVAGTSPQIMRYPRLDVYPVLQRFCRPTVNVPHTTLTRRLTRAAREMSEYGPDCDEKYVPYLPSDVKEWEPDEGVPSPVSDHGEQDLFADVFGAGLAVGSLDHRQSLRKDTQPQPRFSSLMCTQASGSFGLNNDSVFPSQGNPDDDFPDIDQLFAESFVGNDQLSRKGAVEARKNTAGFLGDANEEDLAHIISDDSDFSSIF